MAKTCVICGDELTGGQKKKLCGKKECKNARERARRAAKRVAKTCIICGDERARGQKKLCGKKECERAHKQTKDAASYAAKRVAKTCVICRDELAWGKRQLCGKKECERAHERERRVANRVAKRAAKTCVICGDGVPKWGKNLCGKKECLREQKRADSAARRAAKPPTKTCVVCKKRFRRPGGGAALYCSSACLDIAHRGQRAARDAKRRAATRTGPSVYCGRTTFAIKRMLFAKQCLQCYYCGKVIEGHRDAHLDHVIPLCKGGSHSEGNFVLACRACNCSKSGKLLADWRYRSKRGRKVFGYDA